MINGNADDRLEMEDEVAGEHIGLSVKGFREKTSSQDTIMRNIPQRAWVMRVHSTQRRLL